ncbi:uncharacterized protein F5147DRAFT_657300 [Suillus discolor]|uniref:DUF6533 domain-containing protein n=1 Tax=Suillus discolor TaxID=1912936 RepID=A0A9P7JNG7_9AGAM|nr:uncharacterized protein F5147DRAFT_657300 [Suillus discolor]KAG2093888.1 hypothetical protein F5147DRAFT_657300 [Suillus discolor]
MFGILRTRTSWFVLTSNTVERTTVLASVAKRRPELDKWFRLSKCFMFNIYVEFLDLWSTKAGMIIIFQPHFGNPSAGWWLYAITIRLPISNDPTWWPAISAYRVCSYFAVAAFVGVTYDWALTFGQEVELIWVRYLGILSAVQVFRPSQLTDTMLDYIIWDWMAVVVFAMLWVIIITRLHAMYQRDRKILISLVVTFLAINTFDGVNAVMTTMYTSAGHTLVLDSVAWIFTIVWEVLALCLAVWIAVKHFCELRLHSAGGIMGDCFTVLMKTHVVYFARVEHDSFLAVSCFELILDFSPTLLMDQNLVESQTFFGLVQIFSVVQMFVLGPRLILGIREYNAKLVADSDAASRMTSIAFQERVHISTSSGLDIDKVSTNVLDISAVPTKESSVQNGKVEEQEMFIGDVTRTLDASFYLLPLLIFEDNS